MAGEGEVARCRVGLDRPSVRGQDDARHTASDIICRDGHAFAALVKPTRFTRPHRAPTARSELAASDRKSVTVAPYIAAHTAC